MSPPDTAVIRKKLHRQQLLIKAIRVLLSIMPLAVILMAICIGLKHANSTNTTMMLILVVIMFVMTLLPRFIAFPILKQGLQRLQDAETLLDTSTPVPMMLTPYGTMFSKEMVCFLSEDGASNTPRQLIQVYGHGFYNQKLFIPFPVYVYLNTSIKPGFETILICHKTTPVLGRFRPDLKAQDIPLQTRTIRGVLCFLICLQFVIFSILSGREAWRTHALHKTAQATNTWPTTEGIINKSDIKEMTIGHGRGQNTDYENRISYHFTINDRLIHGNQLWIGYQTLNIQAQAEAIQKKYAPETVVMVAYDPAAPTTCVLEKGHEKELAARTWDAIICIILSVILSLVIIYIIWVFLGKRIRAAEALCKRTNNAPTPDAPEAPQHTSVN